MKWDMAENSAVEMAKKLDTEKWLHDFEKKLIEDLKPEKWQLEIMKSKKKNLDYQEL